MTALCDEELRERFVGDGFVVIPGFLSADEVVQITENAERCVREQQRGAADMVVYYHDEDEPQSLYYLRPNGDPFFTAFGQTPRIKQIAATLLGESVIAGAPSWLDKPPGYIDPTLPHQDLYYQWLVPPCGVMFWFALDEVDEQNACLRYVRGSHELGVRPHGDTAFPLVPYAISDYGPEDRALEITTPVHSGDLIAHDFRTIHRTDSNQSATRHRRALIQGLWGSTAVEDPEALKRFIAKNGQRIAVKTDY